MPRYFISTYDRIAAHDEDGIVTRDLDGLSRVLRQTLASIAQSESLKGQEEFSAEARDEDGRRVMSATLRLSVTTLEDA